MRSDRSFNGIRVDFPCGGTVFKCVIQEERYAENGRLCLKLVGAAKEEYEGEPITTATCNISCMPLREDEVLIKNYSENEGMVEALFKARVIKWPKRWVESGFVKIPVCELAERRRKYEHRISSERRGGSGIPAE